MAQIGAFTRDDTGTYNGTIQTLTLKLKATIRPCDKPTDNAPDHRVYAGAGEIGEGWTRKASENGTDYLSLIFDDPSLPGPIFADLVQGEKAGEHRLIWSR